MKGIGAVTLLLVLAGTSYAQVGDPARGSTLYHTTYKCTDCHGDPPNPVFPGDKFLLLNGKTAAGILNAINNAPEMFKYATTLGQSAQDLADLAAYIVTLAPPPAANYQGLWWATPAGSESGWGINFAHQGNIIFATWFTYDLTGKGMWLVMTAQQTAPNTYTGTLYSTKGPPFNAVPFNPAQVTIAAVGNGTLTFSNASNGTFSYTVNGVAQNKAITREVFGPLPSCAAAASSASLAAATNYQDLWWAVPAGSESGWGINLNHEGDVIFATWFTYDLDGSPMWLVVTANKTAPGVYTGTLYRTTGPAFNSVPFNPGGVVPTAVGLATFTFVDGNNATFAYTVNGIAQQKAITREVFGGSGTVCQ
ncbi:MAG TPA: hypothetical protein VFR50_07415 [Casimicrobiaceae bacterium]|nr:hypothetical protein [Casimicrobiaceae bacterium]